MLHSTALRGQLIGHQHPHVNTLPHRSLPSKLPKTRLENPPYLYPSFHRSKSHTALCCYLTPYTSNIVPSTVETLSDGPTHHPAADLNSSQQYQQTHRAREPSFRTHYRRPCDEVMCRRVLFGRGIDHDCSIAKCAHDEPAQRSGFV
jgi:hypothetical protein